MLLFEARRRRYWCRAQNKATLIYHKGHDPFCQSEFSPKSLGAQTLCNSLVSLVSEAVASRVPSMVYLSGCHIWAQT